MKPGLCERVRSTDMAAVGRLAAIVLLVGVSAFAGAVLFGVRINTTMSEPIGLYVRTTASSALMVEFCPPGPIHSYRRPGNCPDGRAPLVKATVAESRDIVELSARGMSVNGTLLPNTAPRPLDGQGHPLTAWPFGRYVVPEGMVWVASTYHPRSFDSRYFGPIAVSAIRSRVSPLLVLR